MDNDHGAQLNQLSRLVFDRAAVYWQYSIAGELIAGITGLLTSISTISLKTEIFWAIIATIIFIVAFCLRSAYEYKHEAAETMRRQSVLSEGLGWPIRESDFRKWKSKAGSRLLSKFSKTSRDLDYYATDQPVGPKRLAEMTVESIFWTQSLYEKMQSAFSVVMIPTALIILLVTSLAIFADNTSGLRIVYAVYVAIPIIIALDLLGVLLRVHRSIRGLSELEGSLESLIEKDTPESTEVLRLVFEYNCILSAGIVIPNWFYRLFRAQIQQCWDQ